MGGQVLNLSGQLHGKFQQHLDARYAVPLLGGHFVPRAEVESITAKPTLTQCSPQSSFPFVLASHEANNRC